MMNKFKRILAISMVGILTASCLTGCGGKKQSNGNAATDIEISYWNSGLGTEWLDAVIEAFEKKYPEYHVTYNATASSTAVTAAFGNEDSDTVDLYMAQDSYAVNKMESLNDVLDRTADGDSKTIREKINPAYLNNEETTDGNVYQLTWGGGVVGFIYNKKLFEEAGIRTLPRTTDELASACDALDSAGVKALCHFATSGYWGYMCEVWFAQYDGIDYYLNNFYACTDENGTSPSKEVFTKQDGRYEVMKACEKIVTPNYVLGGSNSNDHVTMQTEFLSGKAAMMISGSWLANEMASMGSTEGFDIMKTPVISSITDKCTTVKKETQLRKVITAIDAVTDGDKDIKEYQDGENYKVDDLSVSAADWEYIRAARNSVADNYSGEGMFIPSYSNAKEGAKKFIEFMYSDEGYKVYAGTLHTTLPISLSEGNLDVSDWNNFEASLYHTMENAEQTITPYMMKVHPIFVSGASTFAGYSFINRMCSKNEKDRVSASEAWEGMLKNIENNYENNWLANIK